MGNQKTISENLSQTQEIAGKLYENLSFPAVLAFYGDLGSGKTAFIQGLAKEMKIRKRIISPTFVILRSYLANKKTLHHIDLYRLNSEKEVVDLGIVDLFEEESSIVAIEWAGKMENLLPKNAIRVRLKYVDQNRREIEIDGN